MNSRQRIFVLSREYPPATVGGTSTVARNLAVGLTDEGANVTVITTASYSRDDVRETIDGVTVVRAGTGTIYNSVSGLTDDGIRVHRRLYKAAQAVIAQTGRPDAIALPDLFCYPEAAMLARRHGAPLVNILLQDFRAITPYDHGAHHVTTGISADREHLLEIEEKAVRESDHTVYISAALSDAVTGYYPDSAAPHSVVHLGVDPEEVESVEAEEAAAARRARLLGAGSDTPLLVACGRLVPVKGFAQLLRALHLLGGVRGAGSGHDPVEPHLILVGVGPEEAALRRLAADLNLESRVSFIGDVSRRDALGWMSVADVAVVPSLWESFCYVCAEMMAFGRPVVAAAVDSLRELVPSSEYGYPVPVSGPSGRRHLDPADLAAALREALEDPQEAGRRGAAARRRVAEQFTNARFAQGVSALCRALASAGAHA